MRLKEGPHPTQTPTHLGREGGRARQLFKAIETKIQNQDLILAESQVEISSQPSQMDKHTQDTETWEINVWAQSPRPSSCPGKR